MIYQGAFRLPPNTGYAGVGLFYSQARNSLFYANAEVNVISECSVPAPLLTSDVNQLPLATVLQGPVDCTGGLLYGPNGVQGPNPQNSVNIGGVMAYGGKLYIAAYRYYDANADGQLSHIVKDSLDLSVADVHGPYPVGGYGAGSIGGYFAVIPAIWQASLNGAVLNGWTAYTIVTRTSSGPTGFAINPTHIGVDMPYAAATPLSYYPVPHGLYDYPTRIGTINTLFNATAQVGGAVVCPAPWRSVLYFGALGLGPDCYGIGGPAPTECPDIYDYTKGDHCPPYQTSVWAYDANDLTAAASGSVLPWNVLPYAQWTLNFPFPQWGKPNIIGAAFDCVGGRLFLAQIRANSEQTAIHVYTFG
jgi:hypothetical protein